MCSGYLFQSCGAAPANTQSPLSISVAFGTVRSSWSERLAGNAGEQLLREVELG